MFYFHHSHDVSFIFIRDQKRMNKWHQLLLVRSVSSKSDIMPNFFDLGSNVATLLYIILLKNQVLVAA